MPTFVTNKKAHFNYEILERFEAGIELLGFEVKSIRAGRATLDGSHVTLRGGEAFLIGAGVTPLQPKNTPAEYEERRNRRLLLTKKEILELTKTAEQKGLTIVPLSMYNKRRTIKVEIAVVRGKKKFDKRESIKKRDTDREVQRTLKGE
ncbi:MAG: SsrA-binding protein SmpB [Candidatus Pacebacteria bacterium]|nr:SsrA-binding protein SmpB [Candidatus Paceibacterota bacterium]